jgi:hypothetical protein
VRTQLSPPVRIVALAGVLLIALAGSALVLLRHHTPGAATVPSTPHATTPAATTAVSHRSRPHVRAKIVRPAVDAQLPGRLRAALERHRIVVAGFYDPQVQENTLSISEARAGAVRAGAGFVAVDLLDNSVAGPLTALLPSGQLLPAPGILIYRRPGRIVFRFDGYLDRAAVAQAALSAESGR